MGYTFTNARCDLTPIDFLDAGRETFRKVLGLFVSCYGCSVGDFRINRNSVDGVSNRIYQRLNYYLFFHDKQLSQSRQAGLKAYWILRYRPLTLISTGAWKKRYDVNAYFAFFTILCEVLGECAGDIPKSSRRVIVNSILKGYENTFIRSFSEYDISKESMMLMADSIKNICKYEIKLHE
jgi:hypothetical protein